eukprot:6167199-Prymnesium_polylepis.1
MTTEFALTAQSTPACQRGPDNQKEMGLPATPQKGGLPGNRATPAPIPCRQSWAPGAGRTVQGTWARRVVRLTFRRRRARSSRRCGGGALRTRQGENASTGAE